MSRAPHQRTAPPEATLLPSGLPEVAVRLRALADACDPGPVPSVARERPENAPIEGPEIARRIRTYLAARRRRDALLGPGWFADPAWDVLLDLLACQHERRQITVSSACIAAGVPATTALRWIGALVDNGGVLRTNDPADRRRVYLTLTPDLAGKLDTWVAQSL